MPRFRWNANGKVYERPDDLLEFPTGHLRHLKRIAGAPLDPADVVEAGVALYWLSIWQASPSSAPAWEETAAWRLAVDFEDLDDDLPRAAVEGDSVDPTDQDGHVGSQEPTTS